MVQDTAGERKLVTGDVLRDRIRGSLLGTAVGDAVGAPLEFLDGRAISARFGPRGVQAPEPWRGLPAGSVTDDTQLTVATALGLADAERDVAAGRVHDPVGRVLDRYEEWYRSQADPVHRRAPGATCLTALREAAGGYRGRARNDSKGCGGVMRIAPLGLVPQRGDVFALGCELAGLTHGHPTGYLAAGFLAALVARVVGGQPIDGALDACQSELTTYARHQETSRAVSQARRLAASPCSLAEGIEALGAGWVAEETLAIALFCHLRYPGDWAAAVLGAANHGGDSDSTAAVAGALAGAVLGIGALPGDWVAVVEDRAGLLALADELWRLHGACGGRPCG